MTKLIVFDVDGTILDSFAHFESVARAYSEENGLQMPCMEAIKLGYNAPEEHDFKWGISRAEQRKHLFGVFERLDKAALDGKTPYVPDFFEGAGDTLAGLKAKGYMLAVVTSKPEAPLMDMMAHHGVGALFSAHRNWDDIKKRGEKEKPNPDMLNSVMQELGFRAADTVMIGDTVMDIKMGLNAGTRTIGVSWGAHPAQNLIAAGAHIIVSTRCYDIIAAVDTIFG